MDANFSPPAPEDGGARQLERAPHFKNFLRFERLPMQER